MKKIKINKISLVALGLLFSPVLTIAQEVVIPQNLDFGMRIDNVVTIGGSAQFSGTGTTQSINEQGIGTTPNDLLKGTLPGAISTSYNIVVQNYLTVDGNGKPVFSTNPAFSNKNWITVSNRFTGAFLIMNATTNKLLKVEKVNNTASLVMVDYVVGQTVDDACYFLLQVPREDYTVKAGNAIKTLIQNFKFKDAYLWDGSSVATAGVQLFDMLNSNWLTGSTLGGNQYTLSSGTFKDNNFAFSVQPVFNTPQPLEIFLPFTNVENATVTKTNSLTTITKGAGTVAGRAVSSIAYANELPSKAVRVTFKNDTQGDIGFMSYLFAEFKASTYLRAKASAGLRKKSDGKIYLFNGPNRELVTTLSANTPVILGLEYPDKLVATQNNIRFELTGVPVTYFSESTLTNVSRLLTTLDQGAIDIAYIPDNVNFGNNFGSKLPNSSTTNPDFPYNAADPAFVNSFDWRTQNYNIRVKNNNLVQNLTVTSPFYYSDSSFKGIAAKFNGIGKYTGGEDYEPTAGWELIKANLGYKTDGTLVQDTDVSEFPYFIMYNRYDRTMRVFLFVSNPTIANKLQVSLDVTTDTGLAQPLPNGQLIRKPVLWSTFLQFKALNDPTLNPATYSKMFPLNSSTSGQFYYADYVMNYDPCIAFFESSISLNAKKITSGDLAIVGKSIGGTVPAGSAEYTELLTKSSDYLVGTLNTPFEEQANTIGDISLKNLKDFNAKPFTNDIKGKLVGSPIEQWEKDVAILNVTSQTLQATGTLAQGAIQIGFGGAKIGAAADITGITSNVVDGAKDVALGAATLVVGAGQVLGAVAAGLQYDAIKDKTKRDDQDIELTAPDPRPNLVFGELSLKGSLSISTGLFNNAFITTPGSKNSNLAPEMYNNGTKGARPLYNEAMGGINLLSKPSFGIGLAYNKANKTIGIFAKTKVKPYIVSNDKVIGKVMENPILAIAVETYNSNGIKGNTAFSKIYQLPLANINETLRLPGDIDITNLIDKDILFSNMESVGYDETVIKNRLNKWIKVYYAVESNGITLGMTQQSRGIMGHQKNFYEGTSVFSLQSGTGDLATSAKSLANTNYATFNYADDATLGNKYFITNTRNDFNTLMQNYCTLSSNLAGKSSEGTELNTNVWTPYSPIKETVLKEEKVESGVVNGIHIFPNPSSTGIFNVEYTSETTGNVTLTVHNSQGVKLLETTDDVSFAGERRLASVNVSAISKGFCVLTIIYPNGKKETRKLIVN